MSRTYTAAPTRIPSSLASFLNTSLLHRAAHPRRWRSCRIGACKVLVSTAACQASAVSSHMKSPKVLEYLSAATVIHHILPSKILESVPPCHLQARELLPHPSFWRKVVEMAPPAVPGPATASSASTALLLQRRRKKAPPPVPLAPAPATGLPNPQEVKEQTSLQGIQGLGCHFVPDSAPPRV